MATDESEQAKTGERPQTLSTASSDGVAASRRSERGAVEVAAMVADAAEETAAVVGISLAQMAQTFYGNAFSGKPVNPEWAIVGDRMKQDRLARNVGLRKEAERRGMLPSVLCDMENGRVEPKHKEPPHDQTDRLPGAERGRRDTD